MAQSPREQVKPEGALAPLASVGEAALARVRSIETLEDAYDAWLELKLEHAERRTRYADEWKKLDEQGAFLVGAVRAASAGVTGRPAEPDALAVRDDDLRRFLDEAEQKLKAAHDALKARQEHEESAFADAFRQIREEIRARVERYLTAVRPKLELWLLPAGAGRKLLHITRVSGDESVLLLYLWTKKIPSRYGFLFDDSTDDVALPPPPFYADEGVAPAEVRPSPRALAERVRQAGEVLPVKGFLPVSVPTPSGEAFYRLLERGPVMELEILDGDAFRNLLTAAEAEQFAGHLLRLKLEGRLELELRTG